MALRLAALFLSCLFSANLVAESNLLQSTYLDDTETVLELISNGSDPNTKNRYGVTALSIACQNGNPSIVKTLLTAGADPNLSINGGESPLMTASRTGNSEVVSTLIKHGAKVQHEGRKGQTALIWAVAEGHAVVTKHLIKAGADPEQVLPSGFTPMLFAARNGCTAVVTELLAAGVDVNHGLQKKKSGGKAPPPGTTPLRIAVENGHFETAITLLEAGADPNDPKGRHTPLHVLTWVRKPNRGDGNDGLPPPRGSGKITSLQFAKLLVSKYGADVNRRMVYSAGKYGKKHTTPFLLASRKADLSYMKCLKNLGADIAIADVENTTPFLAAAGLGSQAPEEEAGTEKERLATLAWLLAEGSQINHINKNSETAMHGAAYQNVPKVIMWLDVNGADISLWNQKNKSKWTPLMIAQGFRPGNFKPSTATINALEEVMRSHKVEIPPIPVRNK